MNSDTRPNPKPDWKSTAFTFLIGVAMLVGIALFKKIHNPQANVLRSLDFTLVIAAALVLFSVIRLKLITIFSLLASIIFLVTAFITKDDNPKLSSMSLLSTFFALAGAIVPTLVSRMQTFLYDRGFRGIGFDVSSQDGGCGGGNWSDSGWGGGDCGGDGGGGDCGG